MSSHDHPREFLDGLPDALHGRVHDVLAAGARRRREEEAAKEKARKRRRPIRAEDVKSLRIEQL
jgi:hypothetical protein